jgi:hypothetical protein
MANDKTPPTFEQIDVAWGQTVILQELITQLIQSGALPVDRAQRVFDFAWNHAGNRASAWRYPLCEACLR